MSDPIETLRRVCEHRDYYGAMGAEVDFEVKSNDYPTEPFEVDGEAFEYVYNEGIGWDIHSGQSVLSIPDPENRADEVELTTASGTRYMVDSVEVTCKVKHD